MPDGGKDPDEGVEPFSGAGPGEADPLLERAVQHYLELRLYKRPPESPRGAARKTLLWLAEAATADGRPVDPAWPTWLARAFLDVEGDVAEATARRRLGRRSRPVARTPSAGPPSRP